MQRQVGSAGPPPCSGSRGRATEPGPRGLLAQPERRVLVGHEVRVDGHPGAPAGNADDVVPQPLRPLAGDEHREEADDEHDERPDGEQQEHDVVGDEQQPLHEYQQPAQLGRVLDRQQRRVVARVELGQGELERRVLGVHEAGVGADPPFVADHHRHHVEQALGDLGREQDREEGHQGQDAGHDLQHVDHDELRDHQEPRDQRQPPWNLEWVLQLELYRVFRAVRHGFPLLAFPPRTMSRRGAQCSPHCSGASLGRAA